MTRAIAWQPELLLALQSMQVGILVLHDWVPASPLNDIRAARRQHTAGMLALGTAISSLLPTVGLALSLMFWRSGWPYWFYVYLGAAYGFLFAGELEAWWIPYLLRPQPRRAAEYEAMYSQTWGFLPA